MATRRIEIDDTVRLQMSVRLIEEHEIEKVVNESAADTRRTKEGATD